MCPFYIFMEKHSVAVQHTRISLLSKSRIRCKEGSLTSNKEVKNYLLETQAIYYLISDPDTYITSHKERTATKCWSSKLNYFIQSHCAPISYTMLTYWRASLSNGCNSQILIKFVHTEERREGQGCNIWHALQLRFLAFIKLLWGLGTYSWPTRRASNISREILQDQVALQRRRIPLLVY